MRKVASGAIYTNETDNAMAPQRKREPTRRRHYVALGSSLSYSTSSSSSLFSSFMSKKKSWSWLFVIALISSQASQCLAKEDDKKRRSTSAPTFAPTPWPTPIPTVLPTTKAPTPAPTDRKGAEKNNDKNAQHEPEQGLAEPVQPAVVPVAPPSAFGVATVPPTLAAVPQLTAAPVIPVALTSYPTTMTPTTTTPTMAPIPDTNSPTWWTRPTPAPRNPSDVADPTQTLDNGGSDGAGGDGTPSLFTESRTIPIPPITVVFEFLPQVVVAMDVSPATGTASSHDGRRHLNDKKQRLEVAMERELISFLTMVLQTNAAQGLDSLTSADLSVNISYEDNDITQNDSPLSGAAFVSGTAVFTGEIAELPTQASLHENLVLYFQFWGAGNLHKHLVDHDIDVARVTVLIDGLPVGSSDDTKDLPGSNGQTGDTSSGEMPQNGGGDDNKYVNDKASLYAGLTMGFMLMFVITVMVLFLRHRKHSALQLEPDQRSAAPSFTVKGDRIPERIGSPQMTLSNSSQEHNTQFHNHPGDESLSSSSASGVVVNMANIHDLRHEEWDALAEPEPAVIVAASPPVSSLEHDDSEQDNDDDDDNDEEANSHYDSMDGSSLFTGSVVTVSSNIMPPPRGALRGSAFQYDPNRLSSVISSARVFTREMDSATSGDSSDKSGDRKSF